MDDKVYKSRWSVQERRNTICSASNGYVSDPVTSMQMGGLAKEYMITNNRLELLDLYDEMCLLPEIKKALDVQAEDIASADVDNNTFEFSFKDNKEPTKGIMLGMNKALDMWKRDTGMNLWLVDYAFEILKYGAVFLKRNESFKSDEHGYLEKLDPRRIRGYITNDDKYSSDQKVTHYLYLIKAGTNTKKDEYEEIPVEELVVLKHGRGPYGVSILKDSYKLYRQFELLSNAMIIHRIVRAPQRRVFMIDTGDLSGTRAEEALRKAKASLVQRKKKNNSGGVDTVYDPESITEDYFLAVNSEQRGSRIETLEGDSSGSNIDDVELILKRLVKSLRIPESYLGIGDGQERQWNDGRVGAMYIDEYRYASRIKLIQDKIVIPLLEDFKKYATLIGITLPEDFGLFLQPPQSLGEYKEMEKSMMLLNVANSAQGMEYLSGRYVAKRYLMLTEEEIRENEDLKLLELGIDPSTVSEAKRMNFVYGDQSFDDSKPGDESE